MKKTITVVLLGLFMISTLMPGKPIQTTSIQLQQSGEILYVDDNNSNGPWDGTIQYPYQHIQDAVENATVGNIIFVQVGIYPEQVNIDKTLMIIGENQNETIIDGKYEHVVIFVYADNVIIENFTIRNSGGYNNDAGIGIESNNVTIKNSTIYRTKTGIYFNHTTENTIQNCTFSTNGDGMFLNISENSTIEGCSFVHNAIGIHLEQSVNTQFSSMNFHTNGLAVFGNNSINITIDHCAASDNTDNHGGMILTSCSHVTIVNCLFSHNGMGVNIGSSESFSITRCDFISNTHFAIIMRQASQNITVSQCTIHQNLRYGVYVIENSRCTVTQNNIEGNTLQGLYVNTGFCDARNNWWGSIFGPAIAELRKTSTVKGKLSTLRVTPWLIKPVPDTGVQRTINRSWAEIISIPSVNTITFQDNDTDDDGCPDWWEIKYRYDPNRWDDHEHLGPDHDGLNNIEECYTDQWGSNPFHKDIFLEIDWMESQTQSAYSNKPSHDLLNQLVAIFNKHNITLHVDTGELGGGEEISYQSHFSFADMRNIYFEYFLHNNLTNPRKGIFHYGIICDYGPDVNFPFMGWDQLDSLLISAQWIQDLYSQYNREQLIVGGIVHQLGSTLRLLASTYEGNDNLGATIPLSIQWWKYHNYKSCMNYYYKYRLLSYSDGTHGFGDFDDWSHLNLSFFKQSQFKL